MDTRNFTYMFYGFLAAWMILVIYVLMLVNRETGKGLGVTLFDSEEAMRRGDEALNAMSPGATERRTSVEYFEVPVQTVS